MKGDRLNWVSADDKRPPDGALVLIRRHGCEYRGIVQPDGQVFINDGMPVGGRARDLVNLHRLDCWVVLEDRPASGNKDAVLDIPASRLVERFWARQRNTTVDPVDITIAREREGLI